MILERGSLLNIFIVSNLLLFLYLIFGGFTFLSLYYALIIFGAFFSGKTNVIILFFIITNIFFMLVFGMISKNFDFYKIFLYIIGFISSFSYAILLTALDDKSKATKIIYILFSSYIIYFFSINGIYSIESFNNIFFGSSRNIVSSFLNLLLINIIASSYIEKKEVNIFFYILNFILCFFLFGRTGIAVSGLLLVLGLYLSKYKKIYFYIIFILLLFCFLYQEIIFSIINQYTNFGMGLESPREIIFDEYINSFQTISDFFRGVNIYNCCSYLAAFDYNLHNSFLFMYSRFGLYLFPFIIICILFVISSRSLTLITLTLIIFFRYFFDQIGLFSILDFSLFYIIISSYQMHERKYDS